MKIDLSGYTSIGDREKNEDSLFYQLLSKNAAFLCVNDGLGGHGNGQVASGIATKWLSKTKEAKRLPTASEIGAWLASAGEEIISQQTKTCRMMTTATYLCVFGNQAIWAHMGDSRIYHFHNGRLVDFTLDHSVSQMLVFLGEITREQILTDPNRSRLTRALGDAQSEPDIHGPVQLEKGLHAFLACSDGLWENVSDSQIGQCLEDAASPEEWLRKLQAVMQKQKKPNCDNNSAAAMFVKI